jgi:hypothetical protein
VQYIQRLRKKYLVPSVSWWTAALLVPVLVLMEVKQGAARELQPVLKPIGAAARFVRGTFLETEASVILGVDLDRII